MRMATDRRGRPQEDPPRRWTGKRRAAEDASPPRRRGRKKRRDEGSPASLRDFAFHERDSVYLSFRWIHGAGGSCIGHYEPILQTAAEGGGVASFRAPVNSNGYCLLLSIVKCLVWAAESEHLLSARTAEKIRAWLRSLGFAFPLSVKRTPGRRLARTILQSDLYQAQVARALPDVGLDGVRAQVAAWVAHPESYARNDLSTWNVAHRVFAALGVHVRCVRLEAPRTLLSLTSADQAQLQERLEAAAAAAAVPLPSVEPLAAVTPADSGRACRASYLTRRRTATPAITCSFEQCCWT